MKVLVTDGDNRAALAVTRSLGRAGHQVIVAAKQPGSLAQASRFCTARAFYPDPMADPAGFIEAVDAASRAARADCILPIADLTALLITSHRDRFDPACAIPFADAAIVERVCDKVQLVQTAAALGVPVPRSVVVTAADRIPDHDIPFPLVVKPWRSRVTTARGWAATSVSHAADPAALSRDLAARAPHDFPVMLQERIEGPGLGVFACMHEGRPVALFAHRRLRERPPWGGVSVLCESIALPDQARRCAIDLLQATGWQGVAMVEFKVDRHTGEPKLMEINGRFWGSLQLAIDSGVDFPRILIDTLTPGRVPSPPPYRVGVRSRWLWGDFDSLLQLFRRWQGPPDLRPSRARAIFDFLKVAGPKLYYDNPKSGDPWPFAVETGQRLRAIFRRAEAMGADAAAAAARVVGRAPAPAPPLTTRIAGGLSEPGLDPATWNALAASSRTNTIFQTHQWMSSWVHAYGDLHQPFMLIADNSGGPAAIAPLMTSRTSPRAGRVLHFMGEGRSDYCDFLVSDAHPEGLSTLVDALLDHPGWDQIDLGNIPAASPTPDALRQASEQRGFRFVMREQYLCPMLQIEGHEEDARRILNKPSLRRTVKAFERAGQHGIRDLVDASEIEPRLTGFFEQHIARWKQAPDQSLFLEERNRHFYRTLTRAMDGTGWLLFSMVELDGRPAALHFGFDYNNSVVWYKPSFDPRLASLSPGNVMVRHLIDYALRRNRRDLDFTVGNEPFKQRFTNRTHKTVHVRIYRNTLVQVRSQTAHAVGAISRTVHLGGR